MTTLFTTLLKFIPSTIKTMFSSGFAFLSMLVTTSVAFLSPIYAVVYAVLFFVLLDTYYGIRVSKFRHDQRVAEGYNESRGFIQSLKSRFGIVSKFTQYLMGIIGAFIVDKYIISPVYGSTVGLTEIIGGIQIGCEVISILENIITLRPDSAWAKILNKFIKSKGEKYLSITIDKEDLQKVKEVVDHKIK